MLVATVLLLALAGVPASTSFTTTTPTPVLTWFVDGAQGSDDSVLPHNMDGRRVQSPFRTLTRARDAVRQWHALHKHRLGPLPMPQVVVRGGVYPALSLTSADAGVRWSAWPGETPILSAGFRIPPEALSVVSNPLRPAGPPVLHVNLKQFGLSVADFGVLHGESDSSITGCSETGKMDVYLDNGPLLLARYPDPFLNGTWQWMYVNGTATPPTKGKTPGSSTDFAWRGADTARISTWTTEKDPWLQGYFQFDWTDTIARIAALTTANRTVHIDPSTPTYGNGEPIRAGARWLGLNLLSELDSAGEYYIDRETGDLYLIPPSGDSKHGLPPTANLVVSVNQTVLNATDVSNLHFAGFTFMHAQGTGVVFGAGSNIALINCTVANHGTMGIAADGVGYTIESSEVRNTGCAGVNIRSGDRATLTPGRSRIVGNSIHSYGQWKRMYQPGISFDAVGDVYANNTIFQAPHSGMLGHGNDCTFEGNNFTELCTESGDAGAWYSGRSWADRGNKIINNHFERIRNYGPPIPLQGQNVNAIHFDDQMSGYLVSGNTIHDCWEGVRLGGGRRTLIVNNTFVKVNIPVAFDNRGMGWQRASCTPPSGKLFQELDRDHVDVPPYSTAYPYLQHIAEDYPCVPVYNNISSNRFCDCGTWITASALDIAAWHSVATNNANFTRC